MTREELVALRDAIDLLLTLPGEPTRAAGPMAYAGDRED
jgi:hypothetical protein